MHPSSLFRIVQSIPVYAIHADMLGDIGARGDEHERALAALAVTLEIAYLRMQGLTSNQIFRSYGYSKRLIDKALYHVGKKSNADGMIYEQRDAVPMQIFLVFNDGHVEDMNRDSICHLFTESMVARAMAAAVTTVAGISAPNQRPTLTGECTHPETTRQYRGAERIHTGNTAYVHQPYVEYL